MAIYDAKMASIVDTRMYPTHDSKGKADMGFSRSTQTHIRRPSFL